MNKTSLISCTLMGMLAAAALAAGPASAKIDASQSFAAPATTAKAPEKKLLAQYCPPGKSSRRMCDHRGSCQMVCF